MMIVPMTEEHVPKIAALENICFSDPWIEAAVRSELENPLSYWLVAVEGGQVAGYIGSQTVLGEADIMNVAVAPEFRRKGVARRMIAVLEGNAAAAGIRRMILETAVDTTDSHKLYLSAGYQVTDYYGSPAGAENCLCFYRDI